MCRQHAIVRFDCVASLPSKLVGPVDHCALHDWNLTQEQARALRLARLEAISKTMNNYKRIHAYSTGLKATESIRLLERVEHSLIPDDLESHPMLFFIS